MNARRKICQGENALFVGDRLTIIADATSDPFVFKFIVRIDRQRGFGQWFTVRPKDPTGYFARPIELEEQVIGHIAVGFRA